MKKRTSLLAAMCLGLASATSPAVRSQWLITDVGGARHDVPLKEGQQYPKKKRKSKKRKR